MRHREKALLAVGATAAMTAAIGGFGLASPALAADCQQAGDSGFTAAVVVPSGAHVDGLDVDATGCDIGIYVGPGSDGSAVTNSRVSGANDHGIFVQDATDITIAGNTVTGNGVAPTMNGGTFHEDKALQLAGTSNSVVQHNVVQDNVGDGGIGMSDDGPSGPSEPSPPSALWPATGNSIQDNQVIDNLIGCGIVLAANNLGAGVWDNTIVGNTVRDTPAKVGVFPPATGGIVVAGRQTGGNQVLDNTIDSTFLPGVIIHANAPGDLATDITIAGNRITSADWGETDGPDARVAVVVAANPHVQQDLSHVRIVGNHIADEDIGICVTPNAQAVTISAQPQDKADLPVLVDNSCWAGG